MNLFKNDALENKTYLVTGASSGIGRATAMLLAECGARVLMNGRDKGRLNETLSSLRGKGHQSFPFELQKADQTYDWVKGMLERTGSLNGVFHSAGVEMIRPVRMIKQAQLDEVLGSSFFAAFGIARALSGKRALVDGASMVFMSSVAGSVGQAGMSGYSAAKAGIEGMVRSIACEYAGRNIRVNSIAAGGIKTSMHDRLINSSGPESSTNYENAHLLGFGETSDIANLAVFLLSPASRWITGSNIFIDGGFTIR